MKAVLKSMHSGDITHMGLDLHEYVPKEKDFFGFDLSIEVGPLDLDGKEIFNFLVASPKYLIEKYYKEKNVNLIFGKNLIIAFKYDFDELYTLIDNYISTLEEPDWPSIAHKICKIGGWEFEDYKNLDSQQ